MMRPSLPGAHSLLGIVRSVGCIERRESARLGRDPVTPSSFGAAGDVSRRAAGAQRRAWCERHCSNVHVANSWVHSASNTTSPGDLVNTKSPGDLVDFDMPLVVFAQVFEPLIVVDALGCAGGLEHVLDPWHHALETAEVNVRAIVERRENLFPRLGHLVLCAGICE